MSEQAPERSSPFNDRRLAETAIRLGLLAILIVWCYRILEPFILAVLWAVIIAVAVYPAYLWLVQALKGRARTAAALMTLLLLSFLVVPIVLLTEGLVDNAATVAEVVKSGRFHIPPPPESVRGWPLIGPSLADLWQLASTNVMAVLKMAAPQLKELGTWLLQAGASAGIGLLMVVFAFLISGVLLAHADRGAEFAHSVSTRLFAERGAEFGELVEATIRSVAHGVVGVAVIQSILAGIGFAVAGVPSAAVWTFLCLISAVVQLGVAPIAIPVIIYVFSTADMVTAVLFLIWNCIIMLLDNVLKPLLLGRGVNVPMLVIFLGAIGGLLLSGIIGLFMGAIVLTLGYKLLMAWLVPAKAH